MFFGQKMKQLRGKECMGVHGFAKKMEMLPSEIFAIEHGYVKPPSNVKWFNTVCVSLNIDGIDAVDTVTELYSLFTEPFVMQKMPERMFDGGMFAIKTDGTVMTQLERQEFQEYIISLSKEHNRKADEYNSGK